jgi:hypothetical protein
VGYPLLAALTVITVEGLLVFFLPLTARVEKALLPVALQRIRRACNHMLAALSIFTALACLPPVVWRIRYGVWMGG